MSFHPRTAPVVNCLVAKIEELATIRTDRPSTFFVDFYICASGQNGITLATIRVKAADEPKSVLAYLFSPLATLPGQGGFDVMQVEMPGKFRVVTVEYDPKSDVSMGALQLKLMAAVNDSLTSKYEGRKPDSVTAGLEGRAKNEGATQDLASMIADVQRMRGQVRLRRPGRSNPKRQEQVAEAHNLCVRIFEAQNELDALIEKNDPALEAEVEERQHAIERMLDENTAILQNLGVLPPAAEAVT